MVLSASQYILQVAVIINGGMLSANTLANASTASSLGTGLVLRLFPSEGRNASIYRNRSFYKPGDNTHRKRSYDRCIRYRRNDIKRWCNRKYLQFIINWTGAGIESGVINTTSGTLTKQDLEHGRCLTQILFTGITTVNAGTLAYGANNALSTGNVTVDGASAVLSMLTFSDAVRHSYAGQRRKHYGCDGIFDKYR
jgi:hypothetical protein